MPEDSHESPELHENDIERIEEEANKKWEEMSDDEKLEKIDEL